MGKIDVLRRVVSLLLILTLITSLFVKLPLSISVEGEELQGGQSNIVNGSFEYPYLCENDRQNKNNGWANVVYTDTAYDSKQLGWKTTATDSKLEYGWLKDTDVPANMSPHMKPVTVQKVEGVAASDGFQFAEVVANKVSSLFQILPVESGENYKWTIHHRGRAGVDTLAFIITDKDESVEYTIPGNGTSDCFQQIIAWMKTNGVTAPAAGKMSEHTVYTTKLTDLYTFSDSSFSFAPDSEHTEKFRIYLISTDKADWVEYTGEYSLAETEEDKHIFFVLTPFSTSFKNSSGIIAQSGGNLLDNMSFTDKRGNNRLENAGFEAVVIPSAGYSSFSSANASSPTAGIGWSTTATDYLVEVGNIKNDDSYGLGATITTETIKPSIRDGEQFAELNANQESSLYQIVTTEQGKMYKWSLSHRGRSGLDTMALIIGPAQFDAQGNSLLPKKKKNNISARDQLMQISDWLYSQTDVPLALPTDGGCSEKIKLYSPKFNSDGGFALSENIFSWQKDDLHTEEWSVWVIASQNDQWYDYGELDPDATYSYECIIPAGQENTIFGFVSHSSALPGGTKDMTYGNLLDNIAFKEYYYTRVEVAMNNLHGEAYITSGDQDSFIWDDNLNGWALHGSEVTIHVIPEDRNFIGAYINGDFYPNRDDENDMWEQDENGEYYFTFESVDSAIKATIIFSAQKVYYDSRCPKEYHYDPEVETTGPEVMMNSENRTYISHAPDTTDLDGWEFVGWKYINPADRTVTVFDAIHTVTLVGDIASTQTFTVYDDHGHYLEKISYEEGITFLGEWKYRQRAIAQIYDKDTSQYITDTNDGDVSVNIAVSYGKKEQVDNYLESGKKVGKKMYVSANDTYVTVTAQHKTGYVFNGWYDKDNHTLVSKNTSYTYKVPEGDTVDLYAHFDPAGCNLKLNSNTYSSVSDDSSKRFTVYCYFSGLHEDNLYLMSLVSDSSSTDNFMADEKGRATVILHMKDGDSAEFIHLPEGCQYTIEADEESSVGFGVKGEVTNKVLTRPLGSQEETPVINEYIIFYKASQTVRLDAGKHYAGIAEDKAPIEITQNSSYTLQVETRYNPSLYEEPEAKLCFYDYDSDDTAKEFFTGTRILMMDLSDGTNPKYYRYTVSSPISKIGLTEFIELGSADTHFALNIGTGDMLTEKLVFVVDYIGAENAESGNISLAYNDLHDELSGILAPIKKAVKIGTDTTELQATGNGNTSNSGPFAMSITVGESSPAINTTYREDDFTNSKYTVKLSVKDSRLPDGSYAVVDGKMYYCNDGSICISPLEPGTFHVNVYSPIPLSTDQVTFHVALSEAVSASPTIPAEISKEVDFTCVDVAIDADVVDKDKVLTPGHVTSIKATLKHKGIDAAKLTISKKNGDGTYSDIRTDIPVTLPTDENSFDITIGNGFTAVSGETYIFTFVGYSGGVPVIEDTCCVVGGYIGK